MGWNADQREIEIAELRRENGVLRDMLLNPNPDQEPDNVRLHREKCDALEQVRLLTAQVEGARISGLKEAMEIVGNMRQSEAGLFDAKHSGQRGCDRSDALYDAYAAVQNRVLSARSSTDNQGGGQ